MAVWDPVSGLILDAYPGTRREFCARVEGVLRLGGLVEAELEERGQLACLCELELQLVPILADMELAGVAVPGLTTLPLFSMKLMEGAFLEPQAVVSTHLPMHCTDLRRV